MRLRGNHRHPSRAPLAALLIVALLLALPGCGSSGGERSDGGTLKATFIEFPDSLDPATAVTSEAWNALQNTYLPLLTYAHADGRAGLLLVPGLAEGMPEISEAGRRYELTLRPGLRYSDGSKVRASDFRSTIERLFLANSPGSPFYTDIVGAEKFAETKKGGIPGIEPDDRSGQIVIHLRRPRGTFTNELALLYAALVPAGTPGKTQADQPPPATGPYAITDVQPGSSFSLQRNPVWASDNAAAMPELPSGHVRSIEVKVLANASTQVNDVEGGAVDWMKGPPPPDRLPEIRHRYLGTQFRPESAISVFYFWMNTQAPPFDDVRVRRAVNYAIDPAALQRIYAGTITPTQQVLPPLMPGHRHFALFPHDLAKAKALIAAAGPADREITVWTQNIAPHDEAAEYYQGVLQEIGFDAELKVVSGTSYFGLIGNQKTPDLDTGWAGWLLDYPHPNDYFEPQLSSDGDLPVGGTNWAHFEDPAIDREIERLAEQPLGPAQTSAYARLDREVMREAPWAPFGNLTNSTFVSDQVDLDSVIFSPIFGQDLTSFRFR
jgi:peptide/nickel transport system substrate-binding protein